MLNAAEKLIQKRATGAYNIVNQGPISPYQIMQMYQKTFDPSHTFERLTLEDLPQVAKAERSNCVLSNAKLEAEGIIMKPVEQALQEAFRQMQQKS
jgi:dTDP-4-dehydrorhamnose reductase